MVKAELPSHIRYGYGPRFTDLIAETSGVMGCSRETERALRFAVLWRKRSNGTQSQKGDRWVERILSVKETCRLRFVSTFKILTDSINSLFQEHKSDLDWLTQNQSTP
jgi:transposase